MNARGYFLISLDYELQWGRFDKVILDNQRKKELDNTKDLVPKILNLFTENDVAATWAVVGMMFNNNHKEWEMNIPKTIPIYANVNLSPYKRFATIENIEELGKYFLAFDSIKNIIKSSRQELASHTYSHYYCLEKGQTIANFKDDLMKAKQFIELQNCKMYSLILPRNQFNDAYNSVCTELDLIAVRTNPENWYWQAEKDNIYKKVFRLIDTFNLLSYNKCVEIDYFKLQKNKPYLLPSSRFFRSWSPKLKFLNNLKLQRILMEMSFAAKHKKYYHLWWHPENFGKHPIECLNELQIIITHYNKLKKKYGFESINMKELGDLIATKKI